MNKIAFTGLLSMVLVFGVVIGPGIAQQPVCRTQAVMRPGGPKMCVGLALDGPLITVGSVRKVKDTFTAREAIKLRISMTALDDIVTKAEFFTKTKFWLLVRFTNKKTKEEVWADYYQGVQDVEEPGPLPSKLVGGQLLNVEQVELYNSGPLRTFEPFNAHDFYALTPGEWEAVLRFTMRRYPKDVPIIDHTANPHIPLGMKYAEHVYGSSYDVESGMVSFTIEALPGDLDGDGKVDRDDRDVIRGSLRKCSGDPGFVAEADYDGDGCITFNDYREWYQHYKNFISS